MVKRSVHHDFFFELMNKYIHDARIKFSVDKTDIIVGDQTEYTRKREYDVAIRINHPDFFRKVICYGNLGLGEAYMANEFDVQEGSLKDFLIILLRNRLNKKWRPDIGYGFKYFLIYLRNLLSGNTNTMNVQRHYDMGDDLFESFLDGTLTYSCGYVNSPQNTLDQLQLNKLDRLGRKLKLQAGEHLLDIGCGYGGLLIYAATHFGVTGVGVTNSANHFERAKRNIFEAKLHHKISIEFWDFHDIEGKFDKVVSVGMMEHLARTQYKTYIRKISSVMKPNALGLIHTIGCNTSSNKHDPFIQKYIFPGSGQPKLSEISMSIENNRMAILDVENIVRHYAYTLEFWLQRFQANYDTLDKGKYDGSFKRMWEYYLNCGIAVARVGESAVYQILFTNDYTHDIPLQRI